MSLRYITLFTSLILALSLPQGMFAQVAQSVSDHWVIKVEKDLTAQEQNTLDQWLQMHHIQKQVIAD